MRTMADFASIKFTLDNDAQAQQRGNFAWGAVTVRNQVVMKDGTKQSFDARWTTIWEKRGAKWIIAHDHYSIRCPSRPRARNRSGRQQKHACRTP